MLAPVIDEVPPPKPGKKAAPKKERKPRKVVASSPAPDASAAEPEVDAAKDKALIDAFSAAVAAAMGAG